MAKILTFTNYENRQNVPLNKTLTDFFEELSKLKYKFSEDDRIVTLNKNTSIEYFKAKLFKRISSEKKFSEKYFFCSVYIAELLTYFINNQVDSWFAFDYIEKNQSTGSVEKIKKAGNICFLICTIFKERSEFRAMKYSDYESFGISYFDYFYSLSGREIGYHMSREYKVMAELTRRCIPPIR